MLEAVRAWLTPPVLFVLVNLVIGTIAVMSKLMSATTASGNGGDRRSLMRAPSAAFDRFRCFSFSRLGLPDAAAPDGGEWQRTSLLRSPSVALDRVRGFSFSRRGRAPADHAPATPPAEAREEAKEQTHIERSQSEAAAGRRPRARKTRVTGREERASDGQEAAGRHELPPAVEVDERADDFIRQFREQLRLQRLDSILRYKDTLRRTGTV
jgi:hypothetical protein